MTDEVSRKRLVDEFTIQLDVYIIQTVNQARAEFTSNTERSCYPPDIKQKVAKCMEPRIRCTQHLLKEEFHERLHKALQKARISVVHRKLMDAAQEQFNLNKTLGMDELQNCQSKFFEDVLKQHRQDLTSSLSTENDITNKILNFYNSELMSKGANRTQETVYNLLEPLTSDLYRGYYQKLHYCWLQREKLEKPSEPSGNIFRKVLPPYSICTKDANILWTDLKDKIEWFSSRKSESKNMKIFVHIWQRLIMTLEEQILNLINNTQLSASHINSSDTFYIH
ncbi:unnamed protein product [Didymodactylos carnosus]|uniref:Uncharacterized protein n=1 Tax=Didymodactylos carnosus TaxID=1234261 RepID=A0A814UWR2_9BILA|nr:unnamed protein product [Didymodactylos carnosus]CAF1385001.1 unnamed protein product [Didymodactylos carnosus]CAF3941793.1 unnamed protein product [Didymodactylos carnosus]CAF4193143.1 unnamed protein product [Didymodactylos carnosus]